MRAGVLLLNMGGPASLDQVEPFIRTLLSDPYVTAIPIGCLRRGLAARIARRRAPLAREHYALIGGASPILAETRAQAAALEAVLGLPVRMAMRYTAPRAAAAVAELAALGADTIVGVPLYPQPCAATSRSSLEDAAAAVHAAGLGWLAPAWDEGFAAAPDLLAAWEEPLRAACAAHPKAPVIFAAHGLPERQARRDPYPAAVHATVSALAETLPAGTPWSLAFQSRLGPVRWLGPYLDHELRRVGREGVKTVIVAPISFVSEHVETRYELDVEMTALAREAGIVTFVRLPTPSCHPRFIAVLAELVRRCLDAEKRTDLCVNAPLSSAAASAD